MNYVEPVRNRKKIAQIKNLLAGQERYRDLLLFVVGINTALRISVLIQLKIGHFLDEKRQIKSRFWIKEQKRGKRHEIAVNQSIRGALTEYLKEYPYIAKEGDNFLFFNPKTNKPFHRWLAWLGAAEWSIAAFAPGLSNRTSPSLPARTYLPLRLESCSRGKPASSC